MSAAEPATIVLVPGVLALLPEYAGLVDPVAPLRAACLTEVAALGADVEVLATGAAARVARHLLDEVPVRNGGAGRSYLLVGNGTAMRTEKAPGHVDERAAAFDDALREALVRSDAARLAATDLGLGAELWADAAFAPVLAGLLSAEHEATVTYDDDPFGVQYWVVRWQVGPTT